MKLLGSTKSKITKDKNGENMPNLKITTIVSVLFNNLNNDYQHDLGVLHTFLSIKFFGQLLNISSKSFIFFLKLFIQRFYILKYGLLIKILNC